MQLNCLASWVPSRLSVGDCRDPHSGWRLLWSQALTSLLSPVIDKFWQAFFTPPTLRALPDVSALKGEAGKETLV